MPMLLKKWEQLPPEMQTDEVRRYYDALSGKQGALLCKRLFDIAASLLLLVLLSPLLLLIAAAVKLDSRGPVFYRQVRITQYNRKFRIIKFRSMVVCADEGSPVTVKDDARVTRVGKFIRKTRLDELGQLFNVLKGDMTFVGTRPEVPRYTERYTDEMRATLLLPAGVTSLASIYYKDEAELLDSAADSDRLYIEKLLPEKMRWNLQSVYDFSLFQDMRILCMTAFALCGKHYAELREPDYVKR